MFTIKNTSNEVIQMITVIDTEVPGCRILNSPPGPLYLVPGQEAALIGYEPGVSFVLRPVINPELPR